jgi:hypothetical protein
LIRKSKKATLANLQTPAIKRIRTLQKRQYHPAR